MSTQKYTRIYDYIHEYQKLVYDFYSKDVVAFLTTYYHINSEETVWEDENVFAGSYDRVGEFSGVKWDKLLLLPVYYIEDIVTAFYGQDIGYLKEYSSKWSFRSYVDGNEPDFELTAGVGYMIKQYGLITAIGQEQIARIINSQVGLTI